MACKTSYELHHNFAKLAEESGFTFNIHRPRVHIDWDKIRCINVENIVRDRKYVIIEQHINDILDCQLESEFDVRILDTGVVKMFRLAQLTVEYQQFCRQYLDRSVYVLRDELTNLMQNLDAAKRDLREREEEIRKLKRKAKHNYRPPIMYGHDNIANMILKTLSNNGEMYPTTALLESAHQFNKCSYCDKAFLNQLYLKGHISRRHPNVAVKDNLHQDSPVKESAAKKENSQLNEEIMELKSKLSEMELTITNFNTSINKPTELDSQVKKEEYNNPENHDNSIIRASEVDSQSKKEENNNSGNHKNETDNTPNNKNSLLEKLEEWKKEERDKYSREIELMRSQILETLNSLKHQESSKPNQNNEHELIGQLHNTIKEQGHQILALKQEISNNLLKAEKEKEDKKNEIEAQMLLWMQKVETQSKQYDLMVQNLNQVAKEAQEARAMADAEKIRAARLQVLLEERSRNDDVETPSQFPKNDNVNAQKHSHFTASVPKNVAVNTATKIKDIDMSNANHKPNWMTKRKSLDDLHQKAQALLNMNSSSSSSDDSSEKINYTSNKVVLESNKKDANTSKKANKVKHLNHVTDRDRENLVEQTKIKSKKHPKQTKTKNDFFLPESVRKENGPVIPRSPVKVVRAKITEEVNNRLVAAGVDPLKNGLHHTDYTKQRMQLQQQQRLKMKKNPAFENVRHAILAYLDTKAGTEKQGNLTDSINKITTSKINKPFSLTSVISNVKNKALSLVKHNEGHKSVRQSLNPDVAKRAIALLQTPPGSAPSTPLSHRRSSAESEHKTEAHDRKIIANRDRNTSTKTERSVKVNTDEIRDSDDSEEETDVTESDHKYYDSTYLTKSSKSLENLIKSPVRRPSTATGIYKEAVRKIVKDNNVIDLNRTQSVINILSDGIKDETVNGENGSPKTRKNILRIETVDSPVRKIVSEDNILSPKISKGVLKNVPSTTSLNKKKVLFDLDAIQTKSISASPSQSTEKSDEKYDLGLINLDDEEWDISSIDNEPLKKKEDNFQLKITSGTSPKIAELKQTIESQLARRNETPPTILVGGVDVLRGPVTKAASIGGSNTSVGSSVFDETDNTSPPNGKSFLKPKTKHFDKDEMSELDLSEFSIDGNTNKKRDSF